ncbi:hypothetical protein MD484_g8343, partial [Candolleomyces efflorescens]
MAAFDVKSARRHFPSFKSGFIFADNAGGSQVAQEVIERLTDYLINTNAQLGADYSISAESTRRVLVEAPTEAAKIFNAQTADEIVFGSSSTLNLENLARGLESGIKVGDEFIVTGEHEVEVANVGPWKKLAARSGAIVKHWKATPTNESNPYSVALQLADVLPLITSKTRIVAFTACSNILGTIVPVKDYTAAIRKRAAELGVPKLEISIDCVAYAPHRRIDVQDWDIDFCVLSFYKICGPHISAMYVKGAVLQSSVSSIVHHFLDVDKVAYKLQPGGPGYELVYATTGVLQYLQSLTPDHSLASAYDAMALHEQTLLRPLIAFLTEPAQWDRGVRVVGDDTVHLGRVPTVSFVVVGQRAMRSKDIVKEFDRRGKAGIRWGHFYAYTLIDSLDPKIDMDDAVVRISLIHYNTPEEVRTIVKTLREILA